MSIKRFLAGGLILLGALIGIPASALELVPGGYGAANAVPSAAAPESVSVEGPSSEPGLSLEFTPRASVSPWSGAGEGGSDGPTLRFDLTVRADAPQPIRPLDGSTSRDALQASTTAARSSLIVGGAMQWSDWSLGGGLGRAHVLGEDVDLLAATLGYGRVRAEIAYGQADTAAGVPQDVLMFSTDLAAWSWLTLESDLAVGSRSPDVEGSRSRNRDAVAAGRFGLRLNF